MFAAFFYGPIILPIVSVECDEDVRAAPAATRQDGSGPCREKGVAVVSEGPRREANLDAPSRGGLECESPNVGEKAPAARGREPVADRAAEP